MVDSRNSNDPPDDSGSARAPQAAHYVQLLVERFPHVGEMAQQLLEESPVFRELCEEYAACTEVIERLARSQADAALRTEYSALRLRLEGELLRCFSEHWSVNGPR